MLPFSLSVILMILTIGTWIPATLPQEPNDVRLRLDGAYEFVSETTILTSPKPIRKGIVAPEWQGLWFFQDNHFSQTLMKKGRLYSTYPRFHEDLGYESSAGTFRIDTNTIQLRRQMGLHPFSARRLVTLTYELRDDTLTLTETMHPYPENLSEGQRITVLRRIR